MPLMVYQQRKWTVCANYVREQKDGQLRSLDYANFNKVCGYYNNVIS